MLFMLVCDGLVIAIFKWINKYFKYLSISNIVNINSYNLHKQKLFRGINNL